MGHQPLPSRLGGCPRMAQELCSSFLPSRSGVLFAFLLAAPGSPSAKKPPRMLNPGLEAVES